MSENLWSSTYYTHRAALAVYIRLPRRGNNAHATSHDAFEVRLTWAMARELAC